MSDPFQAALEAIFASPMAVPALYVSLAGGSTSEIRVILRQHSLEWGRVRRFAEATGRLFDVRHSDVPTPVVGDAIIVDGAVHSVTALPQIDAEGLTWTFEVPLLDRAIIILKNAAGLNDYGDAAVGYAEAAQVPAARLDLAGQEAVTAPAEGGEVAAFRSAVFFVPWSDTVASLTPKDRIREDAVDWDIVSIAEIGTRIGIEVMAVARAD